MNDVLLPAKEKGYGVGFFNAVNVEMARAVIETAEELNAPVMVGTAEHSTVGGLVVGILVVFVRINMVCSHTGYLSVKRLVA
jgi:fructose/tagatose bisphosphate aldolase